MAIHLREDAAGGPRVPKPITTQISYSLGRPDFGWLGRLTIIMSFDFAKPAAGYLEQRTLRKHARVLHLWALGTGAVISGDFFGWNFGLTEAGFGGMVAALAIMTLLFAALCSSIAEMSPALPHAGGAYSFARTAMGPWGGYITGLAENMEYILTPAVIVVGLGGYLGSIFGTGREWDPLWWLVCYIAFVAFNIAGVELSFRVSLWITICALLILVVFFIGAAPHFNLRGWALGSAGWFPHGWAGVLRALPFALWVYLGIEQLPLAAEESHDPVRDMPKGLWLGLATLVVFAFLTVVLNAGIEPGSAVVGRSDEPLLLGFRTIFGPFALAKVLALFACTGLAASFHAIIYAYGRQIYSLSRAGYFPSWLSVTSGTRQTPERALIAGSVLGYGAALAIQFAGQKSPTGAILLNMAVFGAVLAYILQMVSFLRLRMKFPSISRPYRSPLGVPGAVVAIVIAGITLIALFMNQDYRIGVVGALVWFLLGILYFQLRGRKHLVLAPEEQFAQAAAEAATGSDVRARVH
ncbi:MAG: ethanolamine permease [Bryobacterales bacterium]|nr:ethanolamine permease [Bryobacterales bacterium]